VNDCADIKKKSVAGIRILIVIGAKEGIVARRSTLVFPMMPTWLGLQNEIMSKLQ